MLHRRSSIRSVASRRVSRLVPVAVLLGLLLPAVGVRSQAPPAAPPQVSDPDLAADGRAFLAEVEILAGADMEGRGVGTRGLARAADHLEQRMRQIGLAPAFGSSYRQPFRIKTGVSMVAGNRLDGVAEGDWTPLGFSSSGTFSAPLVFVGYGLDVPSIGYRELEGIDLKGKVALMLRYEPQERDEASPFDGKKPSRWSSLRYKAKLARDRGAVAVVFVTGPLQDEGKDKVPALKNDGPESPAGLPVIQVKLSVAQKWLAGAGIDLAAFQAEVDRDLRPRSRADLGVKLSGSVALEATWADAENVAGAIPGRGALASEVVVLGAHYDHLGYGGERSMKPNEKAIHPGADDNASGTSAVLLAATKLAKSLEPLASRRTVAICLFSGEEVGLAGSAHFAENPPFPMEKTVAMLNLDMVGRLRDGALVALGAETAAEWNDLVASAAKGVGLSVNSKGDGYGPSDQTSFAARKVPVLHFFTGAHDDYHSPADLPATLNVDGGVRVARLVAAVASEVVSGKVTPVFRRGSGAPAAPGDSRGYGAWLGTVPDYSAMEDEKGGVLLSDVRPGGPAEKAGIRGKDRIVEMAGTRIENLYDMTFALQDHKPGETIDVVVIRDGGKLTLRATLGERGGAAAKPAAAQQPAAAPEAKKDGAPPAAKSEAAAPAEPKATPAPAPVAAAKPAAGPADPHAAMTPKGDEPKKASFYDDRPGAAFVPKAGKPFSTVFPDEPHLADIRQLTFGGENAEAYFSPDGTKLIYQMTPPEGGCDAQYVLDLATGESRRVSSGLGRTTCGYYDWPEADRVVYASTEAGGAACPPAPEMGAGYVWSLYDSYDLWEANPDGSSPRRLTTTPGYDAEATWCHRGGKLVFTSIRSGDLELWEMDEAGEVRQLTSLPGYDGGAFYSPDCSEIVFRASRPEGAELEEYRALLAKGLIRPKKLEIQLMNADGSHLRAITSNGAANFCPFFHPDGKRIVWSSNFGSGSPREFDLWMVDKSGGTPERVTTAPGFDGFPMWSPDGRWFVWGSNRANPNGRDTNLFLARWVDGPSVLPASPVGGK